MGPDPREPLECPADVDPDEWARLEHARLEHGLEAVECPRCGGLGCLCCGSLGLLYKWGDRTPCGAECPPREDVELR